MNYVCTLAAAKCNALDATPCGDFCPQAHCRPTTYRIIEARSIQHTKAAQREDVTATYGSHRLNIMSQQPGDRSPKRRRLHPPESSPYVLKKVLEDIPLASEDGGDTISITCVEFWSRSELSSSLEDLVLSTIR